jgi:hypothetical protein
VVKAIELMLTTTSSQFRQELASHRDRVPHDIRPDRIPIFPMNINTFITPFALRLVKKQYQLAIKGQSEAQCTSSFFYIYGLPCCHEIRYRLGQDENWCLKPQNFDIHWWFERPSGPAI